MEVGGLKNRKVERVRGGLVERIKTKILNIS